MIQQIFKYMSKRKTFSTLLSVGIVLFITGNPTGLSHLGKIYSTLSTIDIFLKKLIYDTNFSTLWTFLFISILLTIGIVNLCHLHNKFFNWTIGVLLFMLTSSAYIWGYYFIINIIIYRHVAFTSYFFQENFFTYYGEMISLFIWFTFVCDSLTIFGNKHTN